MSGPDDLKLGHWAATATVNSTRRNLFYLEPGRERHIGTLIGGSRTGIAQFDADCEHIVRALAHYDAAIAVMRQHIVPEAVCDLDRSGNAGAGAVGSRDGVCWRKIEHG